MPGQRIFPLKILTITNLYPPYVLGGYELLAFKTIRALRERGHEVYIATGKGREFSEDDHLLGIYDLDLDRKEDEFLYHAQGRIEEAKKQLFHPGNYTATRTLIKQIKPDIVSIWNLYKMSVSPWIAARHMEAKTVTHLTDRWLLLNTKDILLQRPHVRRLKRFLLTLIRATIQPILYELVHPDNLIVPSKSLRDMYLTAGFPKEAFRLVPHGIELELFSYVERGRTSDNDAVRLLYVGQLWEGKGVQVLLRAVGRLKRRYNPTFQLNIYGTGAPNFINYLQSIVKEERLDEYVCFCGTVPYEDLASVYHMHDVLIFPSIWNEPFALVPLEAMCTGLPVIASDAGGTKEAVQHEETGLIVHTNDVQALSEAISRLVRDEGLRQYLGQQAAANVRKKYGFENMIDQIERFYLSIVGK